MTYSILAEGLVKRYGDTVALDGIDLAVRTGSVFGLLGPNGAGKTTALRILAMLVRPDGGHAAVCGHDVVSHAHQVRQLTGLTGQYASVADEIAVVDHGAVIATGTPEQLKTGTGAQSLSVRPASPADVRTVMAVLAGFTQAEAEVRGTTVTVPVSEEDVLPAIMRRFEDAGVRVAELTLRGSSLDEVFLSLTGRRTGTEELEGSAA